MGSKDEVIWTDRLKNVVNTSSWQRKLLQSHDLGGALFANQKFEGVKQNAWDRDPFNE